MGPSENMGFIENPFEDFTRRNIKKQYSRPLWNNPVEHKALNDSWTWTLQPERNKLSYFERAIHIKTVDTSPRLQLVKS